jgi:hypothetical protein
MNYKIQELLYGFEPVSLSEIDSVQFLNRYDTKYIFSIQKLPEILWLAAGKYRILEINRHRNFIYHNTYLDTGDFYFFYQQAKRRPQRFKVRYRTYESTDTSYLEIKQKSRKGKTIKWRIESRFANGCCDGKAMNFLKKFLPNVYLQLRPVLMNRFSRIILASIETQERITIDHTISFNEMNFRSISLPYLAIAELKKEDLTCRSQFGQLMRNFNIRPAGFSKYCIGNILLRDMPWKNSFKPGYLMLNKIEREYNALIG